MCKFREMHMKLHAYFHMDFKSLQIVMKQAKLGCNIGNEKLSKNKIEGFVQPCLHTDQEIFN